MEQGNQMGQQAAVQNAAWSSQIGQSGANVAYQQAPPATRLELVAKGLDRIGEIIANLEALAERVVGSVPPPAPAGSSAVPNGALDQIENTLANLVTRSDAVLGRLQRIG